MKLETAKLSESKIESIASDIRYRLPTINSSGRQFEFKAGEPACPVGCKYCFITEHDQRREVWNQNPIMGINKACTFVNVPPWITSSAEAQEKFKNFPMELLRGDFIGFTAITDPFWPKLDKFLWDFLEKASEVGKLVTCVTKWPISKATMERLAEMQNFFLVLGITGNQPPIEKVPVKKHLETLALAKELGVKTLPISHPYIAGVSDLSFLEELKNLGYDYFDVKGLRYCDAQMGNWMPEASKIHYQGREDEEVLPEDGWREKVAEADLTLLSPRQWYLKEGLDLEPHLTESEARNLVEKILALGNIVTSDSNDHVYQAALRRRL